MADEQKKEAKPAADAKAAAHRAAAAAKAEGGAKKPDSGGHTKAVRIRLRERYDKDIIPRLMDRLSLKNKMAVPKLTKICLNIGFGKAATENNAKAIEQCVNDLTTISGQKAVITRSKKSISNFKLREGMQVGCRVTLRGPVMYEFLDRLVNVAIPRIRDFRGVSPRAFDGRGNYSLGIQEHTIFPEVDADRVDYMHGMDVTICTTARNNQQAFELLKEFGMPFRER